LEKLKAREIAALIAAGDCTCTETADFFLSRIESLNPKINAFISFDRTAAMARAEELDRALKSGKAELSPLYGVPVALKDNMQVKGQPTTCASKILTGHTAVYDAGITVKCLKAGMVIVGKTNLDEFAMGSSNENSAFGPVRNPINTSKVPGGSSGGSAAAVAAAMAPLAFGSDTGGSVRLPAAFCGIVGLRPSYGRISRYGLVAFASSLDQIGPFALDTTDMALVLAAAAGHDRHDSTSVNQPVPDYAASLEQGLANLRIGIPREYFGEGIEQPVRSAIDNLISGLRADGVKLVDISLPTTKYCIAIYYIIANAEASSNLARYDGVKYGLRIAADSLIDMYCATRTAGFGAEVKRRIMLGTYVLSAGYYDAYYRRALKVRSLIRADFDEAFKKCDLILSPTSPSTAFAFGERTDDPLKMYLSDVFTVAAPLAGLPAISLPCGLDPAGLPIGVQLVGRYFDEESLLRGSYHIERMLARG